MMIVTELNYSTDLDRGVVMQPLKNAFLSGDQEAHRFVVGCYRGNSRESIDLTGAGVTGYFIRADGRTVVVDGTTKDGEAVVELPAACYAVVGRFSLVIKASLGDVIHTILWVEGTVSRSHTDKIIDPGEVVPTLDELLAQIDAMKQATANANTAAAAANAAATEAVNIATSKGDEALQNVDDAVARQDEVISQLSEEIEEIAGVKIQLPWESGSYVSSSVGSGIRPLDTEPYNLTRKRFAEKITLNNAKIICANGYKINVFKVYADDVIQTASGYVNEFTAVDSGEYRIIFKADDDANISQLDASDYVDIISGTIADLSTRIDNVTGGIIGGEMPVFAEFEGGTFINFSVGSAYLKSSGAKTDAYASNRKRTVNPVFVKSAQLNTADGYSMQVLVVEDGIIQVTAGYVKSYEIKTPCHIAIVLKKDDGSSIVETPAAEIITIVARTENSSQFSRPNVYWTPKETGKKYTPSVTVDSQVLNYDTDVAFFKEKWDELAAEYPETVTVNVLGKDQSGLYDVYSVSVKHIGFDANWEGTIRPKVMIASNVHGYEKESSFGIYYLVKDLLENYKTNDVLRYFRYNVDFEIMPCVNPWGYMNNTYENSRGVNLNHNFDDEFHQIGYGAKVNSGEFAFSEAETQYMRTWFNTHTDAIVYVDYHTTGSRDSGSNRIGYLDIAPEYPTTDKYNMTMVNAGRDWINQLIQHLPDEYNLTEQQVSSGNIIGLNTLGGYAYSYSQSIGVYGQIIECPTTIPGGNFYDDNTLKLSCEMIGMYINTVLDVLYRSTL